MARYLIVSDAHGDARALEAVLADAGPVAATYFLGDAVDFGPEPAECVRRLRAVSTAWVQGNHDAAVGNGEPGDGWSPSKLSAGSRTLLADLPEVAEIPGATLRHYFRPAILPPEPGDFDRFTTPLCFIGHTHVPFLYVRRPEGDGVVLDPRPGEPFDVTGLRAIANPGSTGSSFLAPAVSSYLIYELGQRTRLTWHTVPRPTGGLAARLATAGAPPELVRSQQEYVGGRLPIMLETAAAHRTWAAGLAYSSRR